MKNFEMDNDDDILNTTVSTVITTGCKKICETTHVLFAGDEREQWEQGGVLLSVPDRGGGEGEAHLWPLQWWML